MIKDMLGIEFEKKANQLFKETKDWKASSHVALDQILVEVENFKQDKLDQIEGEKQMTNLDQQTIEQIDLEIERLRERENMTLEQRIETLDEEIKKIDKKMDDFIPGHLNDIFEENYNRIKDKCDNENEAQHIALALTKIEFEDIYDYNYKNRKTILGRFLGYFSRDPYLIERRELQFLKLRKKVMEDIEFNNEKFDNIIEEERIKGEQKNG